MPDIFLYSGEASPDDIKLRDPTTAGAAAPVVITPDAIALLLATFAPIVTASANITITPAVASLTLTGFAPTVPVTANVKITPATVALALAGFAPSVLVPHPVTVTPATNQLLLIGQTPDVAGDLHSGGFGHVVSDTGRRKRFPLQVYEAEPITVSPAPLRLHLTTFAPSVTRRSAVAFTIEELSALADEVTDDELAVLIAA